MSESEKTIQEECYGTCWGAQQRIDELTQQLNLANERIKRLEDIIEKASEHFRSAGPNAFTAYEMADVLKGAKL